MKALTSILTLTAIIAVSADTSDQPNIMVFLVDDMGVMDTSVPFLVDADGNPKRYPLNDFYRTPAMERLADRGIRFTNFYAMSVCSPTRISIMTGQNAARHRATNWINPDKDNAGPNGPPDWNWFGLKRGDTTLPGILRDYGYHTIHVGKAHFGPRDYEGSDPANLGFDINIAGASFGAPGSYYAEKNYGLGTRREKSAVPHLDKYHGSDTFLTEALTIEAKAAVSQAVKSDKPFYLYFSHYAVHAPFESDPRFADNYTNSGKPENAQAFATLIEGMDKSLGDMLDHFDDLEIAENTFIIFVGDNGSDAPLGHQHEVACAAPLRGKKGAHYEGGMRVPFIAAWAANDPESALQRRFPIARGDIQSHLGRVHDLFPTVLSLAGASTPVGHPVDGLPLNRLFTGGEDYLRKESFLMHYPHSPHRSEYFTVWRENDWKLIYHYFPSEGSENARYQLFNLESDPFEQRNVANANPETLDRMMKALVSQLDSHHAVYPIDENGNPLKPRTP
jgi:arylsulfatase A-like enzyme